MNTLLDSGCSVFVACAGAGLGLVRGLWATPGASRYFVGAAVPYAREETDHFLGFNPDDYCSRETALDLAIAAYMRAARVGDKPVGVGITAVIASEKEHRGDHRIHVAAIGPAGAFEMSTVLTKGVGEAKRQRDGLCADMYGIAMLTTACGLEAIVEPPPLPVSDADLAQRILARPFFAKDGRRSEFPGEPYDTIFPGAFNPVHDGHREMTKWVESAAGDTMAYELSLNTPHKAVTPADILRRVARLDHDAIVTDTRLYRDKARKFPGVDIVIGADAALRMLDPQWCPVEPMLEEFAKLGTHFLVFDRGDLTITDVRTSAAPYTNLFIGMGPSLNLSSTAIREGRS